MKEDSQHRESSLPPVIEHFGLEVPVPPQNKQNTQTAFKSSVAMPEQRISVATATTSVSPPGRVESAKLLAEEEGREAVIHGKRTPGPCEALLTFLSSWFSKKFMSGCAILFPLVVTVYITWWFLTFFDNFFSPLYQALFGFHVFGLGFMTSMMFIFFTGVFVSSYFGGILLSLGEWIIRKVPLVKHIYSASKQIGAAVNPDNGQAKAFKECVIIRHPRHGEYAFAFITGETTLQSPCEGMESWQRHRPSQFTVRRRRTWQRPSDDMKLFSVYVPTNHVYVGDVFLLQDSDIIRTNISVREGLEIVVSIGMAIPSTLVQLN
uniref:Integral membrane protein n=1 Tax=Tetraselmis sp. GSL018 TaxID=582737 RepID=A0A061RPD4_9CHLO